MRGYFEYAGEGTTEEIKDGRKYCIRLSNN